MTPCTKTQKQKNILTQGGCFFTTYQNNPVRQYTKQNNSKSIQNIFGKNKDENQTNLVRNFPRNRKTGESLQALIPCIQ